MVGVIDLIRALDYFRELNTVSIALRLALAMLFGGLIGLERGRKRRPAGFRTYMLVCIGSALAMLLGQYEMYMLTSVWGDVSGNVGILTDVSRFGAQVINGIGFLGAGTVLVTGHQEIKGLTTAAALWACACTGLAIGAGFYECVFLSFALIFLAVRVLPSIEIFIVESARNMNLYVELASLDHVGTVINCMKAQNIQIYDVDIDQGGESLVQSPGVVFSLRLRQKLPHTKLLSMLSEVPGVLHIKEL